jgi:chromosomal replication initiation ATPase DnaA
MVRGLAARRGGPVVDGPRLRGWPEVPAAGAAAGAGLAVDDADCAPEEAALLHLLNICAERRQPLLMAGREPPARWPVALPDLRSRLRATAVAEVRPPEDALLAALLRKHFADRQLRLDPALAAWLLPREAAAVAEAAARLDRAALARGGGRVTRALAALAMRGMPGFGAGEDDVAVPAGEDASTPGPRLF